MRWGCALVALVGCGRVGFDPDLSGDAVPVPVVGFQFANSLTDEAVGTHPVSIALSEPSTATVTVDVEVTGGSATEGDDYQLGSTRVTLLPGETQADLLIVITNDGAEEPDETIELHLTSPTGARVGAGDHEATISSDILPRVQFATGTSSADEAGGDQSWMIMLDVMAPTDVVVGYGVAGTASDTDHSLVTSTVTIPAGALTADLTDAITNDVIDEFDETIDVTLTAQSGAVVGATAAHVHTIVDEDPPPSVGFSTAASQASEGVGSFPLTLSLSVESGKPISVDLGPSGGTATPDDYTLGATIGVMFAPGVSSRPVTISPNNDAFDEDDEIVNLILTNPSNATIRAAAGDHAFTIVDDDAPPVMTFQMASAEAAEGGGIYQAQVVLSAPSQRAISFSLVIANNTAAGNDYMVGTGPYMFAPGTTSLNVPVSIVDDARDENDETFSLVLSNAVNATIGTPSTFVITIHDNDTSVSFDPLSIGVASPEGNGAGTSTYMYTVRLSAASADPVAVDYTVGGTSNAMDRTVAVPPLVFPPGQTSKTILITVNHDNTAEPDETVVMTLTSSANAEVIAPATRVHTIANDD